MKKRVLNVMVLGNLKEGDKKLIFPDEEEVITVEPTTDMYDLLVMLMAFKSKSDARRNWTKTGKEIPSGWSAFDVGKFHNELSIWNPSPESYTPEEDAAFAKRLAEDEENLSLIGVCFCCGRRKENCENHG